MRNNKQVVHSNRIWLQKCFCQYALCTVQHKWFDTFYFVLRFLSENVCLLGSHNERCLTHLVFFCFFFLPQVIDYRKFTLASDIWSFGIVLFEIWSLARKPYFPWNNEMVRSSSKMEVEPVCMWHLRGTYWAAFATMHISFKFSRIFWMLIIERPEFNRLNLSLTG